MTPLSTNGGSVLLAGSSVWYAPLSGLVGLDQWSYTLTDACGASATGTVSVTVISSNAITLNPIEQGLRGDGLFYTSFQGVPGLRYVVDCATNVMGPWDSEYTNLTAGPEGVFEFQHLNAPPQPQRFYRVRYP